MKLKTKFLIILCSILSASCSINGSFQGLYSYYSKTKGKNPQLLFKPNASIELCKLKISDTPKVYIINAAQLKHCISKTINSLVYIWAPKCKSKVCYPLNLLQQQCDKENFELFIVAEYYDYELMQFNYKIEKPIFGIDTEHYQSNLTSKYLSEFLYELTDTTKVNGRFISFRKGNFVKSFETIEEINTQNEK